MSRFENLRWLPRFSSLCLFSIVCLLVVFSYTTLNVNGQFFPPPPPPVTNLNSESNGAPTIEKNFQFPKAFMPPSIEIMTTVLNEGKNVFKLNITSQAPIENCKITFTKGELKKTEDCVTDGGTTFKALIDARPPYQTVNVYTRDIYGDSSNAMEKLSVLPSPNFFESIWNSINQVGNLSKQLFQN